MKKNEILPPDETTKNIEDFQNLVLDFLEMRGIEYDEGIAMIGSMLIAAFRHVCTRREMSAEKTKKAFDALLDKMRAQQDKGSDNFFEEGDNETTDAN